MINKVRLAAEEELEKLLSLYQFLNPDDPLLAVEPGVQQNWQEILAGPLQTYFVIEEACSLVSSCVLVIVKNLTRSARPYALIENVVTHPDYRKQGYGTAVLQRAVQTARSQNCYKVMLMTSRKDGNTLNFYEQAGFKSGDKTGFIIRF